MKKILKDNYNIDICEYKEYGDGILFFYNSSYFYFCKCYFDEEYLINLNYFCLKLNSNRFHYFIYNKNGALLSDNYVLMKINVFIEDISEEDICFFQKYDFSFFKNKYLSFDKMWEYRIDYLERQLSEISLNTLINNSFDYFIGISEILIKFYRENVNNEELKLSLSHNRLNTLSTIDYYNPLNLSLDCNLKDWARYFKGVCNEHEINDILKKVNIAEKCYLFVRLVFPFEYFNEVSDVLLDGKSEDKIIDIISEIDKYEEYIWKIEEMFGIYLFSWIKKE